MGFFSDLVRNPITYVNPLLGGLTTHKKREDAKADAATAAQSRERVRLMEEGMGKGRELGERVYGQSQETTGTDVQDVIKRRRERLNDPSFAADTLRRTGQQERRYASRKGASDAQKRNISYQAALAAGQQEDLDYNRRLEDFQSLVGNIAGTQSSLELGGGQLGLASQYIAPPRQNTGLLSGLGLL